MDETKKIGPLPKGTAVRVKRKTGVEFDGVLLERLKPTSKVVAVRRSDGRKIGVMAEEISPWTFDMPPPVKPEPPTGKPCRVKGCTRLFVPGKGCADGVCSMHYRRFKRTGVYGEAAPEFTAGDPKKAIKIYGTDELAARLKTLAKDLGTSVSEWGELVLDKESKKAIRRKLERDGDQPAA